jgi:flavodoxin
VWRYTGQFKEELEMALDLGLRDGLSADELSREVRKYLNNPNMLFRRVRDEHGVLHLSKRAKAYHPGQGVYRSSYKNARRLTATETNMAYRTADYNAYQAQNFVVGIRIMLSNNHTLNGEPFFDICDNLSAPNGSTATKGKGCYPKDFKFTGWHPLCRCFVQSIHKTKEELREDRRRKREGLPPLPPEQSANYVGDVPDEFKAWVKNNGARIVRSQSLPYFMQDNPKIVAKVFHEEQPSTNLSRNLITTIPYMTKYAERDPRVAAILNELDNDDASRTDFEQAMLANRLKAICANITYADMRDAGLLGDNMIMARIERDFVVQSKVTYTTTSGKPISIREVKRDMIILRDKYGRKFAYPVGTDSESMLISPKSASETFHSLPRFLIKDMDRVSFYNMACPVDDYWKVEYRNPNHTSAATDGGRTSFWETTKGMSDEHYKRLMVHEAAHWLDTRYSPYKYSSSARWAEAVNADIELAKANRGGVQMYPTDYAKTNLKEDFAESMAFFLTDRRKLKDIAPNRERYLHNLTKMLNSRLRY